MSVEMRHYAVARRATMYRLTIFDDDGEDWYLLFASNMEEHNGDWLKIPAYFSDGPSFAWSYLTEKCPGLLKFKGDKAGWIAVCKEADIKVFDA